MTEIQELKKKFKDQKQTTGVLAVLIIIMTVLSIISIMDDKITFSTYLPLFFIPLLLINIIQIKKLKSKIKSEHN